MSISTFVLSAGWGLLVAPPAEARPEPAHRGLDPSAPTAVVGAEVVEPRDVVSIGPAAKDEAPLQPPAPDLEPEPRPEPEPEPKPEHKPRWRGFRIASEDETHSLAFQFLGQLRVTARDTPDSDPQGGVAVRLARPVLIANLWNGRVAMRLMPEFAGAVPSMLDATTTVRVNDAFAVQAGQFRPWLNRGFRTGLPVLGLPGRGAIVDRFRVDRDVGVTVHGQPWGGKFEYYVGAMNGSGRDMTTLAPSPLLTTRLVVAPLGAVPYVQTPYVREVGPRSPQRREEPTNRLAVAVGASGYTVATRESVAQPDDTTLRTPPRRRWGASGDVVVSRRRLFGLAEGFYEHRAAVSDLGVPALNSWGAYAQAGVLLWNPFLDLTLRAGFIDDGRPLAPVEPGLNAYIFGNSGKLQVSYRCDINAARGESGCAAHTGTLQAQLQF